MVQVGDTGRLDYSMANVTLTECWHNGGARVWAFGSLTTSIIRVVLHGAFSWQVVIGWASFITFVRPCAGILALTSVLTFIIPDLILDVHNSFVQTALE